jgi:two-component system, chemotaxis family, sensor histidine kinase and response regulator WspE
MNLEPNAAPSRGSNNDASSLSLLDLFCMEVRTQIVVFNHELLNLETSEHPTQSLQALMRSAHSIKGAARIVQVEAVVVIAHELEEYFVAAQAGKVTVSSEPIDCLLQAADLFSAIVDALEQQQPVPAPDSPEILAYQQSLCALLVISDESPLGESTPESPVESTPELSAELPPILTPPVAIANIAPERIQPESTEELDQRVTEVSAIDVPLKPIAPSMKQPHNGQTVRIGAEHLRRLMDLAGESLVSANNLQNFAQDLLRLKAQQTDLNRQLERMRSGVAHDQLQRVCQKAQHCQQVLIERQADFEIFAQKSNQLADRLYRQVIATQMRPFSDVGQGFPRMVRDLGRQLGKQVRLRVSGQTTLVDRDILDRLETPLTHLLRNAIDHGIETPELRQMRGKPSQGTIYLEANHRAGVLFITVRDDGRGINLEQLRRTILEKGLTQLEMAQQMSEAELLEFLYLPGFSTAKAVTDISGRGVGLDIVRNMVQAVEGTLRTTTKPGQGTTFHLQLPLTLSVLRTLLVQIADEPYAIALSRVDQIVTVERRSIIYAENQPYFLDQAQPIALIAASELLNAGESAELPESLTVIMMRDRENQYGLIIDRVLGEQSLVVRPLDQRLGKVPNISAAALLHDGTPLFIIDVEDLLRSLEKRLGDGSFQTRQTIANQSSVVRQKRVLVVDDSITVREMERKLLENAGYCVDVAVDGMDGWNAVNQHTYDLIVTDVDMPRLSGIELVKKLKAQSQFQAIPTIVVSYKDREVDRMAGLEAGADYYLTKRSFHDDMLLQAVMDLIG